MTPFSPAPSGAVLPEAPSGAVLPEAPSGAVPLATYRVQLHAGFGFDDVAAIAPYLAALGISHVYCSPYLQAAPGSMHGYDVVDHRQLNEELGGDAGYERMCAALAANGLSHIVDIVPNHMSVAAGRRNAWWWDVLENGPSSRWASFFDIDWEPPDDRLRHLVLLPVLGDHYGRVLEDGDIRLEREDASFVVRYFEHEAPISPRSLDELLGGAAEACGSDELASIAVALGRLPPATATDRDSVEERHRDKEVLRANLARLLGDEPAVAAGVDAAVAAVNAGPDALDALLQRQNYRLAYWRTAGQELDYRRFFDIPELVALRMEDARVFDEAHELVLHLVAEGRVDGLRVDHPDGLRDPLGYFRRLRSGAGAAVYVVAEKILEAGEALPPSWPVQGTTGYDFLNQVAGLFVDPAGEAPLTELYRRFADADADADFGEVAYEAKLQVMRETLAADLDRLTALAQSVCERHRRYRDYTRRELLLALRELAACFPVYRSYVVPGSPPSEEDVAAVDAAVAAATTRRPDLDPELLAFLRDLLLGRVAGDVEAELAVRFQQFTSPVMAKGVEDTAFYRFNRLVALNEVGGDPGRFGTPPEGFHSHNAHAASTWPATMLSTSTHDTKRSEDVRARMAALSEIPEEWAAAVGRWAAHNQGHRTAPDAPDANTEFLLYQTLVGAWPIEVERAVAFMEKAIKEAKRQTSWITPDAGYEDATRAFVEAVLADRGFVADLEAFVAPLVEAGQVTSLAQLALKLTSPGVPDVYQGTELWDLSLVDPDNRRPVDYELRRRLLDKVATATADEVLAWADDGAPKLWLAHRALGVRRRRAAAFAAGAPYAPVTAAGDKARHVVAYLRGDEVLVVVPRLVVGLGADWGRTRIDLPAGRWGDELGAGGVSAWEGTVSLSDLLALFPVAILGRA
jgi:(1->4)-alpha-D-glucan 1-alpha-D-glucosylmutase